MDSFAHPQPQPHQYYPNNYYPTWSYGGNFGYPAPREHHGCCNHTHTCPPPPPPPPHCSYNAGPPHPHPHPALHIPQGYYPPYAGTAYPPYHVPPHFFMDQPSPKYEYDKEMRGGHCCGCPNHACQPKQNKGVRIEEHEPEPPKERASDSLAPVKFKGHYPFPHVWFPPEYVKDKDFSKSFEMDPKFWNGWQPVGLKNDEEDRDKMLLQSLQKIGDAKADEGKRSSLPFPMFWFPGYDTLEGSRTKDMKNDKESKDENACESLQKHGDVKATDQNNAQFPFPVFWFPGYDRLKESGNKEMKAFESSPQVTQERPPKLKIIPVNPSGNGDHQKPEAVDGGHSEGVVEKDAKSTHLQGEIPGEDDKNESTGSEKKSKEIHVRQIRGGEEAAHEKNLRNQSSSPRKVSKLPPVCLRVDPLPRRKTGGGTSRSPSPPAAKSKVCQDSDRSPMVQSVHTKSCSQIPHSKEEQVKPGKDMNSAGSEKNVIPTENNVPSKWDQNQVEIVGRDAATKEVPQTQAAGNGEVGEKETASDSKETSKTLTTTISNPVEIVDRDAATKEVPQTQAAGNGEVDEKETASDSKETNKSTTTISVEDRAPKRSFSITEAAVLIQSFYKGFHVRKWQPLNKLRQIAKVREQVNEVRERVRNLESSSELKKDGRQRILIGEAIMSLLLQLDAIQGLHENVRDIRKSVAKELTCLQEQVDSLFSQSAVEEDKPEVTGSNNLREAPPTLDVEDMKRDCVHQQLVDTEYLHKIGEQHSDLFEAENVSVTKTASRIDSPSESAERQAEADQQLVDDNQELETLPTETESRGDSPPGSTGRQAEAKQQLAADNEVFDTSPAATRSGGDSPLESTEREAEADQQLAFDNQVFDTLPSETRSRGDSPPEFKEKAAESDLQFEVKDQVSTSSLMETESASNDQSESTKDAEETDWQLLNADKLSTEVDHQLASEDQLPIVSFSEGDRRNDSPAEITDKAEEGNQLTPAADQLSPKVEACSKPSTEIQSPTDCPLELPPLPVEAIEGDQKVNVEAVENDRNMTGEPTVQVTDVHMAGEAPHDEHILVKVEKVGSKDGGPCTCNGENRSNTVPGFSDSLNVDIAPEPVAKHCVQELPEVVDEFPLCNMNRNQELVSQDGGSDKTLGADSGFFREVDEEHLVANAPYAAVNGGSDGTMEGDSGFLREVDEEHLAANVPCAVVKEDHLNEQATGVYEENAHCSDNYVAAEPMSLTGNVLMSSQYTEETSDVQTKECVAIEHVRVKCGEVEGAGEKQKTVGVETDAAATAAGNDMGEALSKENEKLRDVLGKLIQEGEKQMRVISDLSGRIKDLERKLTKKNKLRMRRRKADPASGHIKPKVHV